MTFAHAGVAFALATLSGRTAIKLSNLAIKFLDLFFAREFALFRGRPGPLVKPGEDEMRPISTGCLGDGQKMNASVGMIAGRVPFQAGTGGDLLQPSQEQRSRKLD